jgi:predicted glutamine amidotransferase
MFKLCRHHTHDSGIKKLLGVNHVRKSSGNAVAVNNQHASERQNGDKGNSSIHF